MRRNTLKTIGILGGMGPEAGADLFMRIIRNFQTKSGSRFDNEFPRIVLNSITPVMPWQCPHPHIHECPYH